MQVARGEESGHGTNMIGKRRRVCMRCQNGVRRYRGGARRINYSSCWWWRVWQVVLAALREAHYRHIAISKLRRIAHVKNAEGGLKDNRGETRRVGCSCWNGSRCGNKGAG
eukprot:14978542-Alexandrium_andersonii.AAC.1